MLIHPLIFALMAAGAVCCALDVCFCLRSIMWLRSMCKREREDLLRELNREGVLALPTVEVIPDQIVVYDTETHRLTFKKNVEEGCGDLVDLKKLEDACRIDLSIFDTRCLFMETMSGEMLEVDTSSFYFFILRKKKEGAPVSFF